MKNIDRNITGILMAGKEVLAKAGKDTAPAISRGLDSWNFNWYTPAYMGFRGAMNLCSLWLEFLSED
ncbi:hypothetical protein [Ruminiclostridium cellobioparum]|uniref:hypothetical protein n=1 Tax=Ruminiclostridium cellobioparum TaxID=29355 RepID=UPI000349D107|nr:hypothetical protein [Ruminiclostridium cellobioparum]